ncbi:MAG: hypothetical protein M1819_004174 [Sarea resinae]|nr:MAG: hypothetical protein M1819_004174 [Sarea resinae]
MTKMAQFEERSRPKSAFESETFDLDMSLKGPQAVGSMSISPCGRDVVLASREGLHVIDLDSPYSPPRHLPHHTPWEVADVQWSPFASRHSWVVSTSNQKALVWNLAMPSGPSAIEHVLHAHSRAITDINFSGHHPDSLATCAVDSFVHCWDLRHPARPAISFCDWFAGATQVKWNRQDSHIIASSHDKYIRIWDDRKGAYPLRSIEAHGTKIYGLDWNRTRPTALLTCSLDKTVKFWDYSNPEDVPERVIRTPFPVWRARHTPFGWGLLAMPQRGNGDLHLYDRRLGPGMSRDEAVAPVHSFEGHRDQVKEFLWRARGTIDDGIDNREFQLVSWGMDREVRLHRISPEILKSVGYEKGKEVHGRPLLTRKNAIYKTYRDEQPKGDQGRQPRDSLGLPNEQGVNGSPRGALTAGMNKTPIPIALGWGEGGFMTPRDGMQGKHVAKKDVNPIAWMKGVKIGKRERVTFSRHGSLPGHASTLLSPPLRGSGSWEVPESLGDEITHVGEKFSKVTFDRVDVSDRFVSVSMNGPWGSESKFVYLKMDIKFPKGYPGAIAPAFKLEKTSSISEETVAKISKELQTIAEAYASRRRGCLEAILRYLLGERKLEESTAWLGGDHDGDALNIEGQANESSSDEEDESGTFQDMEMSGTDILVPPRTSANVPRARDRGARFSNDGKLIYFLPPKEERARSLLSTITLRDGDRSSAGPRIFEGLGRLHTGSPGPKHKITSIDEEDEDEYGSSEESPSSSSSSDSGSSSSGLSTRFQPPIAWRRSGLRLQRIHSADHSQRSSAGTGNLKQESGKIKSLLSVRNFEDLLPAKRSLAEGYGIFGNGPDICAHNAKVASHNGYQDIADVWEFLKLLLFNEVPLDIMPQTRRKEHILVIARRALRKVQRRDSGLDLAFDELPHISETNLTGRVKWGRHPLGGAWLVDALFKHFEQLADVQMLAMLSCVLSEPAAKEGASASLQQLEQREIPMTLKSPAFSVDYFPSEEIAWSLYQHAAPIPPRISHSSIAIHGSTNSSNGPWGSDPTTPYSTGTTPPHVYKARRASADPSPHTQSLSTSPENHHARRANSNLASVFAASFSRPFSGTVSSTSPPSNTRKRPSPVEHMLGALPSGAVTWGANTILGSGAGTRSSAPISSEAQSPEGSVTEDDDQPNTPKQNFISVKLKNQNLFDQEGHASTPLLSPDLSARYKAYRECYAHLLHIWNLPLTRCEILKFNGLVSYFPAPRSRKSASLISLGKKRRHESAGGRLSNGASSTTINTISADDTATGSATAIDDTYDDDEDVSDTEGTFTGLTLTGHCRTCGRLLRRTRHNNHGASSSEPTRAFNTASGRCTSCSRSQHQLACVICNEVIHGLYAPCLGCGHISHADCHALWYAQFDGESPDGGGSDAECVTGCGCLCAQRATAVGGRVEGLLTGGGGGIDGAKLGPVRDWDEDAWEEIGGVAFGAATTLGRGVGAGLSRGLFVAPEK